jgi:membrane-associated protease RseP (regulator of RpoE activity)
VGLGIFIFIVSILIVVMIHESGHFISAKHFDFKATQFFVGFGPTLWSTRRGETEYGIKALPLGGFVKILGMNPYEEVPAVDEARSYPNKPRWQRAIVLVAGSATHFVVGFLILLFAAMLLGFPEVTTRVASTGGGQATPASRAGFQRGDRILAIDGRSVKTWDEVRSFIRSHPQEEVAFTVRRDGERRSIPLRLGSAISDTDTGLISADPRDYALPGESLRRPGPGEEVVGFLGVSPTEQIVRQGPLAAIGAAGREVGQISKESVLGIGGVFAPVFNGSLFQALSGSGQRDPTNSPIGLVGAGRIAGQSVDEGQYLILVELIVRFTIFVGILNLLPLPPLDGGHLAVLGYEAITRRRVDLRKLIPVAAAVISFFVLLFIAVLYLDLARPVNLPF